MRQPWGSLTAMPVYRAAAGPVFKSEPARRYTLGPMYPAAPEQVSRSHLDAHGEYATAEDLQHAVWDYVRKGDRIIRAQHTSGTAIGEWVELMCMPGPTTVPLKLPTGEV